MKIIIIHTLLAVAIINAEPLKIVEAAPSEVSPEESQTLHAALQAKMPEARISMQDVSTILDPILEEFLPNGKLFRLSAVVMDPTTLHGALLNFVIYEQGNERLVMPMSGSHSEFAELLNLANKKINNRNDALVAGRGYSSVYGIKLSIDPEITTEGKSFIIRMSQGSSKPPDDEKATIELRIDVDEEHKVSKVESKLTD